MAYKKAHFKTGYGQREIPMDCTSAEDLVVGAMVTITGAAEPYVVTGAEQLQNATHIVAQSDFTMEHGKTDVAAFANVPSLMRDKMYSDKVARSGSAKKMAFFAIVDKTDIVVEE